MSAADRRVFLMLILLWLLANLQFWWWWSESSHVVTLAGFILNTLLVSVDLLEPGWFLFFVWRMRYPVVGPDSGRRFRIAAGTTKTPSEPLEVVGRTLLAIRFMEGDHDTWLLDEGDDPRARAFCEASGVLYFTRKDIERYQQPRWPFQRRMKAGNYNAWLDYVGYDKSYDVFCQFDSDHRPSRDYLRKTVPLLEDDDRIAYVAAPSICVRNWQESWMVLARAEVESTFHGPLQSGFNGGYAPLIIGSHCTFRMSALREIGGFQTTWCEDHDNSLALNSTGYEGVFQPDAIAIGDGPTSFAEAMQQEYQWARGLAQILLSSTPRWLSRLSFGKRLEFLFCQTWYPRTSLIKLGGMLLPAVALVTNTPLANVSYVEFVLRQGLVGLACLAVVHFLWLRRWTRPAGLAYLTWRSPLYLMARWPWIALACGEAVLGKIVGRDFAIKVTAKGTSGPRPLPPVVLWPYAAIVAASATIAALFREYAPAAQAYALLALINAAMYASLIVVIVVLHLRENAAGRSWHFSLQHNLSGLATAASALLIGLVMVGIYSSPAQARVALTPSRPASAAGQFETTEPSLDPATEPPPGAEHATIPLSAEPGLAWPAQAIVASGSPNVVPVVATIAFPPGRVALGAYDPGNRLADYHLDAEMIFHDWRRGSEALDADLSRLLKAGRQPVVTLEPYAWGLPWATEASILQDIAAGRYDETIRECARTVRAKQPNAIVIRFAHEMDLYRAHSWSRGDPAAYIRAYQHVADLFRDEGTTNAVWLWSPAGNGNAGAFYPGDEYVDFVGVTLLASEDWDRAAGLVEPRSFLQLLKEKYKWAWMYDKPLVIAETGVAMRDPGKASRWLTEARDSFRFFALLRGVLYFNAEQPPLTPNITVFPDWRLRDPGVLFPSIGRSLARK